MLIKLINMGRSCKLLMTVRARARPRAQFNTYQ